ncbi:MAG: Hsp20/alpha crystallin family protein [Thiogranum sp.]|nr:Hsp20/alpha crystallin family protein [Thiogranum sp.]
MTEKKDVSKQEKKSETAKAGESRKAAETERAIRPPVDIFEDESGITVQADMPGVSKDRLQIQIEGDNLSFIGNVDIPVPEAMDALYADIRSTAYRRSFSLSRELDAEHCEAQLHNGVLTLRIPKREEHKPRKIEVQAS